MSYIICKILTYSKTEGITFQKEYFTNIIQIWRIGSTFASILSTKSSWSSVNFITFQNSKINIDQNILGKNLKSSKTKTFLYIINTKFLLGRHLFAQITSIESSQTINLLSLFLKRFRSGANCINLAELKAKQSV